MGGIEPPSTGLEAVVLPLHYIPLRHTLSSVCLLQVLKLFYIVGATDI